ncbi:MAG: class I SAM-dependent methyltransferase [Myxococcota bacterium]|nr:class I SAM-dependent methyltransferase [Myxococcota bacterium]
MEPAVRERLRAIVSRFYEERGAAFAAHREGPWPGFTRVLVRLPKGPVLDVGCGEGRFGVALARMRGREAQGHGSPSYVGVDASTALLARARERSDLPVDRELLHLDVATDAASLPPGPFAGVVALGLMHHVPGRAERAALIEALAERVAPGGLLAVTLWRFRDVARLERLELPWEDAGLSESEVEPGDALLSFAGDARVPRYCHFFDADEVEEVATGCPLPLALRFRHDGRERELNEYLLWERPVLERTVRERPR